MNLAVPTFLRAFLLTAIALSQISCGSNSTTLHTDTESADVLLTADTFEPILTPDLSADVQSSDVPTSIGTHELVLLHDGFPRAYRLIISAKVEPATPVPLLIGLHRGSGSIAGLAEEASGFLKLATEAGWIVVLPQGLPGLSSSGSGWWSAVHCCGAPFRSGIDDVGFIESLLTRIKGALPINEKQVVLIGIGNGAMLAQRLAGEKSALFSNVVAISGTIGGTPGPGEAELKLKAEGTVSLLLVHGRAPEGLLVGDGPSGPDDPQHIDAKAMQLFWGKETYNCLNTFELSTFTTSLGTADKWVWSSCKSGLMIIYSIDGLGYNWPSDSNNGGYPAEQDIFKQVLKQARP